VPFDIGAHFDEVAARYTELRSGDYSDRITDFVARFADLERLRVLDVGCGTGRVAGRLASVFGVDAVGVDRSAAMIAEARRDHGAVARFEIGDVEQLPFDAAEFDAVLARMMVHLVARPVAFVEISRILRPGGRVVVSTADPERMGDLWLAAYFPSFVAIDAARFPTVDGLQAELAAAGFTDLTVHRFVTRRRYTREQALAKIRGRAFSTFALIDDAEFAAGLARAEAELPELVEYDSTLVNVRGVSR
jgi:ubiquinone/menaquinone biosynthesis C-methylase UbiE